MFWLTGFTKGCCTDSVLPQLNASSDARSLNRVEHASAIACLGRCFDYGNYKPPSVQFRVRVTGPNDVVAGDVSSASDIRSGQHIVTAREEPLYTVCAAKQKVAFLELRKLGVGETTCLVKIPATGRF